MKLELTEESVFSAVDFIVEGCRHQADRGYLDDISYYEFRAKLQGIILLLIGHADFLVDRVVAAQNEVSSIYKQSTGLALSPAQPVEAVGQGATASCEIGENVMKMTIKPGQVIQIVHPSTGTILSVAVDLSREFMRIKHVSNGDGLGLSWDGYSERFIDSMLNSDGE
jgi:hypothetical protein